MKVASGWVAGIVAMVPIMAHANDGVPASPAMAGEIALHIAARGKTMSNPDRIVISVPVQKDGDTAIAARAANQAAIDRLKKALAAIGVDSAAVVMKQPSAFGFVGNEAIADEAGGGMMQAMPLAARRSAGSLIEIRLTDLTQIARVRDVLDQQDLTMTGNPMPVLLDDRGARDLAIADAMRNARRDADAYARTLGLTVGRIVRISNDCAMAGPEDYRTMIAQWASMWGGQEGYMVETRATACIDFMAVAK